MFDRGYQIVCRDAAVPVGQLYVLRARGGDPAARLAAPARGPGDLRRAPSGSRSRGWARSRRLSCRLNDADVGYRVYVLRRGARHGLCRRGAGRL